MKTASQSSEKFVTRAGAAQGEYVEGASASGSKWKQGAKAAVANHKAAVQESLTRDAYSKGIDATSDAVYVEGVKEKGSARYAAGVSASRAKYETKSQKFDAARAAASSLPRGPRGSEQNYNRSKVVGAALRKVKTGQ